MQKCSTTEGMPLKKYWDAEEETVCEGCRFYPTKTEAVEKQILSILEKEKITLAVGQVIEGLNEAWFLEDKKRCGAFFQYPGQLSAFQWTCLSALNSGRDRGQSEYERNKPQG